MGLFSKKSKEKKEAREEEDLLLAGSAKVNDLSDAVEKKDYRAAKKILRQGRIGGMMLGLRYFARDLEQRHKDLAEQIEKSGKKVSLDALKVFVDKLLILFSMINGEIPQMLKTKNPDWETLKEKVEEAKTDVLAAIVEEKKILKKL